MSIGCVFPKPEEEVVEIKGRCLMTGLPRVFQVSSNEMIEAFEEPVQQILEAIHSVLERTPPELVADISSNGIVMTCLLYTSRHRPGRSPLYPGGDGPEAQL